jgi:hypothetical protein
MNRGEGRQRCAIGCVLGYLTGVVKALPGNFVTAADAFDSPKLAPMAAAIDAEHTQPGSRARDRRSEQGD